MSRFGSDPLDFFNSVYQDIPPWEIGAPQPVMAALLNKYPPSSPILDVGCGSGDLSIYLAKLGYQVVGIDFVEKAIANAREKAAASTPDVARYLDFQLADALKPSLLQRQFGAVVDSGFFHLFNPEQCDRLVEEVSQILLPVGHYYLHEFSIEFPISNMPRNIDAQEIQARFTLEKGWHILDIQSVEFLSRVAPPVPGICACVERLSA
jgi:2-polyprenyl-3-methyl-5-hydroxy-6-metoxy-1,4-benzoquinol methylase